MKIPRNKIEEIKSVPEMAGRKSQIALTVAQNYLVFGVVWAGVGIALYVMGLSWMQGGLLGLLFAWLHSAVRELRWCVERVYYAIGDSKEDQEEDNSGFPWARRFR